MTETLDMFCEVHGTLVIANNLRLRSVFGKTRHVLNDVLVSCPREHTTGDPRSNRGATTTFDGVTFDPKLDQARLTGQLKRVRDLMSDGKWRTLSEISDITGDQIQAVSARLRDLRKIRFGSLVVNRRRRGEPSLGLFEYQVL